MKEKWKNWWWYHWWHVLLAAAAAGIILYSFLPGLLKPKDDYSIAVISLSALTDETAEALKERIMRVAEDADGDGSINIRMNQFSVDLSGAASAANYQETARLDAELVGKVSSMFFIEDPAAFRANTAVPVETGALCAQIRLFDGLDLPDGMILTIRSDCTDPMAQALYSRIVSDG